MTQIMTQIRGVSLFTGGGLCDVGLSAFVKWVGGVELDPAIAAHATKALGHTVHCASVIGFDYSRWEGIEYLHVSPPCTNASVANANAGETPLDIALSVAICDALRAIKPIYFTLENVRGYLKFESFKRIVFTLKSMGFDVHYDVYDAADFGVPQRRKRLMLRARRDGKPIPEIYATHTGEHTVQESLFGCSKKLWVGWYEAVKDLLPGCPESALAPWQTKRLEKQYGADWLETMLVRVNGESSMMGGTPIMPCPALSADGCGKFKAQLINGVPRVNVSSMISRNPVDPAPPVTASQEKHPMRALLVEGNTGGSRPPSVLPPPEPVGTVLCSGGGREIRAVLVGTGGYNGEVEQIPQDSPTGTIATVHGTVSTCAVDSSNSRVVALTPRCLARFQSLPDSYPLPEGKTLATKIIGNGVPCLLAEKVFGSLFV